MTKSGISSDEGLTNVRLIRRRGLVQLHGAHDAEHGVAVVIASAAVGGCPPRALSALQAMAEAHQRLDHPLVPRLLYHGERNGQHVVVLDCDAQFDLLHALDQLSLRASPRLPYAPLLGMTDTLLSVLSHAHEQGGSSGPICIGGLCFEDILLSPNGHWWVTGFGRNRAAIHPRVIYAPEVAAGAPATPGADVFAMQQMLRSGISVVHLPKAMTDAFAGRGKPEVVQWFRDIRQYILGDDPGARPGSARDVRRRYEQHWRNMSVWPDAQQMRTLLRDLLSGHSIQQTSVDQDEAAATARSGNNLLNLAPDGCWFETVDGRRVDLTRRRALRGIVAALGRQPKIPKSLAALTRAGWPGERMSPSAGRNRAYVAVSTLRRLGLPVQRRDDGYLLAF